MKSRYLLRAICLLALLASFIPAGNASALVSTAVPPVDMFQLPWEQGLSWVAIDGLDNGTKRPLSSSHNFTVGGAIDFAPHNNMVKGENTSTFWTTAAAAGTVVGTSSCHVIIDHGNGWITQYQFLANVQVKLGDAVSRNQHLGIIADGVRQKFCPGSLEPNVPHLHFMLRPTMRDATFAGWQVNYLPVLNKTTFTKNGETLGLFKPLLNVIDSPSTPTPTTTTQPTNTPTPSTTTPVPTALTATSTAPSGPFVLTEVNPTSINIDESALVTVSLNNVPPNEYTSAEFTCTYDESLVEASNISVASLFGTDPVTAINGPQDGSFIVAIAGSVNNKATASGTAFTFDVKGLQAGQTAIECTARVSTGDNVLTALPSIGASLGVLGILPTPTITSTPIFSSTPSATPDGSASTPSATPSITPFPSTTPISGWLTFTNSTFGYQFQYPPQGQIRSDSTAGDTIITDLPIVQSGTNLAEKYLEVAAGANATECKSLFQTQDPGVTVTINGISFLKQTGLEGAAGSIYQWVAYSTLRNGVCVSVNFILHSHSPGVFPTPPPVYDYATESAIFDQIIGTYMWLPLAPTATPTFTPVESPTPTFTAFPTVPANWLTFTDVTYSFLFKYPPQGVVVPGNTDNFARINLPFQPGTNLGEKYLQVDVGENANPCRSPVAAASIVQSSETVLLNGITFLKETGKEPAAGNLYQFVAYSTSRGNACVSLSFVLHSVNPDNIATPIPVFDYVAESAVFGQIVSTYTWLALAPTPTFTSTPLESPTPVFTFTPVASPTATPPPTGTLTGQVIASKAVTINLYDASNTLVASVQANTDGTFAFTAPSGSYTAVATASGYLSAQASVTLTGGNTTTLPTIDLLAGDIDDNNEIDQFDAMSIGMSYNTAFPDAADLNNDGIINVLDLELLAKNYRKTGPVVWE